MLFFRVYNPLLSKNFIFLKNNNQFRKGINFCRYRGSIDICADPGNSTNILVKTVTGEKENAE